MLYVECGADEMQDIYQRSVHVESSSGAADTGKKKFPWFARDK